MHVDDRGRGMRRRILEHARASEFSAVQRRHQQRRRARPTLVINPPSAFRRILSQESFRTAQSSWEASTKRQL